jgi:hypothetical protein
LIYNQTVLDPILPAERIVTLYRSLLSRSPGLSRVIRLLNLSISGELIEFSVRQFPDELRHRQFREEMADETVNPGIEPLSSTAPGSGS